MNLAETEGRHPRDASPAKKKKSQSGLIELKAKAEDRQSIARGTQMDHVERIEAGTTVHVPRVVATPDARRRAISGDPDGANPRLQGDSKKLLVPTRGSGVRRAEHAALLLLTLYLCVRTLPRGKGLVTDFPNCDLAAQLAHDTSIRRECTSGIGFSARRIIMACPFASLGWSSHYSVFNAIRIQAHGPEAARRQARLDRSESRAPLPSAGCCAR